MARVENDTWDLASSVGVTATVVAAQRAIASRAEKPLIDDPYAEPLVAAVGVDAFTRFVRDDLGPEGARVAHGIAVRTRYLDEFLGAAVGAGIRQVVILAAGLDARAYRLRWPAGTTVYELDQPQVIEFKTGTLAGLGVEAAADHRPIGIDLRDDWPAALLRSGFDAAEPTAWIAEGLLIYLPPEAQDRLLDNVTALSAPGSRFASENTGTISESDMEKIGERMRAARQRWNGTALDEFARATDIDVTQLFYAGERTEAVRYLAGSGWTVQQRRNSELFAEYGLPPQLDGTSTLGDVTYLSAILDSPQRAGD